MHADDLILVQDMKRNDHKALKRLFDSYYPDLCLFAVQITEDSYAAEDIVQNFFIGLWDKRETINIKCSFKAYSAKSVYNAALNYSRTKTLNTEPLLPYHENIGEHVASYDVEALEKLNVQLEEAIERLPLQCRRIFKMIYFEEKKYIETAAELGISINTVKVQMSRAYKFLREEFADAYKLMLYSSIFLPFITA